MTLEEIKAAVDAGSRVHWNNGGYVMTRDRFGQYLITYARNETAIGLTNQDGNHLNGKPEEFFIADSVEVSS